MQSCKHNSWISIQTSFLSLLLQELFDSYQSYVKSHSIPTQESMSALGSKIRQGRFREGAISEMTGASKTAKAQRHEVNESTNSHKNKIDVCSLVRIQLNEWHNTEVSRVKGIYWYRLTSEI